MPAQTPNERGADDAADTRNASTVPESRSRLFAALVELASDEISVLDAAGRTVYANAAGRAAYEAPLDVDGMVYVHPDDVAVTRAANERVRAVPGGTEVFRIRLRQADGRWHHVESVAVNLLDDPDVRGVVYLTRDVTDRVRAERELERQLAGQQLVADLGLRSLRGAEVGDLARDALDGLCRVLQVDHAYLLDREGDGMRVRASTGPVEPGRFLSAASVAAGPAALSLEQRAPVVVPDLPADPRLAPPSTLTELGAASSLVVPLDTEPGPTGVLAVHTVTPREFGDADVALVQAVANVLAGAASAARREAEARHRAHHDPLTGLANRALLQDRTTTALRRATRDGSAVALVFVDLDGFKEVNDTHGHAAGDLVLAAVAERLRTHFRSADTVARLGGDEFVVLCGDVHGPQDAELLRRRLAGLWDDDVVLAGEAGPEPVHVLVRAAVGIAVARPGETDAEALLARADAEMYRQKRAPDR